MDYIDNDVKLIQGFLHKINDNLQDKVDSARREYESYENVCRKCGVTFLSTDLSTQDDVCGFCGGIQ